MLHFTESARSRDKVEPGFNLPLLFSCRLWAWRTLPALHRSRPQVLLILASVPRTNFKSRNGCHSFCSLFIVFFPFSRVRFVYLLNCLTKRWCASPVPGISSLPLTCLGSSHLFDPSLVWPSNAVLLMACMMRCDLQRQAV